MNSKTRRLLLLCLAFCFFILSCSEQKKEENMLLRHVVLIKFKEGSTAEQIKAVEEKFTGLSDKIKEVKDFEWGTNVSPENLAQGFTHCFFVTFINEKDRDIYLPHPDHKEFVNVLVPVMDQVLVVDYFSKN